jgi:hypothetical protein
MGKLGLESNGNFADNGEFHAIVEIFYISDTGPSTLRPLRKKARWVFFCPVDPTGSAEFEPANLVTKSQRTNL